MLERQRARVAEELARHERELPQLTFDFDIDERRQLESDMRSWRTRLEQFDRDLETESRSASASSTMCGQQRVEPIGLVYLWPETN